MRKPILKTKPLIHRWVQFVILLRLVLNPGAIVHAIGPWTDGQNANLVLGQPDFTTNTFHGTASATTLGLPYSVAVDAATGKVFVADYSHNRVLRYASGAGLTNGAAAEAVLGQPNFTANASGTTTNTLSTPSGVWMDASGRLWVSDMGNHRVLRFDNAASKTNGANADGVLGQSDFVSSGQGFGASQMSSPRGLMTDSAGRLWVADQGNARVLRFDNAAGKANGDNADGVLGQPNFTSTSGALSQSGMYQPSGVALTSDGALFVADFSNKRVLRFDNAAGKANGANADGVLGQPDFVSNTPALTQSGMNGPFGVAWDSSGRLYVADYSYSRVLIFNNAAALANGANADNVLGQTTFTTGSSGVAANRLNMATNVFADNAAGALWVADAFNYRVLRFAPPLSTNADLAGLSLSSGALTPAFSAATTAYTATVANNVTSLTVTATTADVNAILKVNNTAVLSGTQSSAINLGVGANVITTAVTAQDTSVTQIYTVTVTRAVQYFLYLPLVIR